MEPRINVLRNIKPVAEVMPAAEILWNFALEFAIGKMLVQPSTSSVPMQDASPSDRHEVQERTLQIYIFENISRTIFWNHCCPIFDQAVCAMHGVLYATAASNRCQPADP